MLSIGKLDSDLLKKIVIDKITYKRPEVKVGSGIGEDCAVVDFGDMDCVISTDPITSSINDIGKLAIHISCNDIASNGIEPIAIMLTVMLPYGTTEDEVEMIMSQAAEAAAQAGVQIAGGHTEITNAVTQPVIVSTAFGRTPSGQYASAKDMKPSDVILMTKRAGLEGTGIICSDLKEELIDVLSQEEFDEAASMLNQVSVVKEGLIAGKIGTSGMHDVTEGGILGAIWEMCNISELGALVHEESIPVSTVTEKVANHYNIDWMRLISSGCMIIVAEADKACEIQKALREENIECSPIGFVTAKEEGIKLEKKDGQVVEIAPPAMDELYKAITK